MIKFWSVTMLAAAALAGTAWAAGGHWQAGATETRAEAQARAARLFDRLDLNHDGKLDEADRRLRIMQVFDRIDTNHDGTISRDEFLAMHEYGHGHEMGAGPEGMGQPGMGHWGYGHREMRGLAMLILHEADPGHTGIVTRESFVRAALVLFDRADTNHDGVLTPEEHHAAMHALMAHMRQRGGWSDRDGADAGRGEASAPPPGQ